MKLRTGLPIFLGLNGEPASRPFLERDERCDVAVIGGGVTGALVALRLVEEGAEVVLLDKRPPSTGSTSASTALLQYEADVELHELAEKVGTKSAVRSYCLGLEVIHDIERLVQADGGHCDFSRKQSLYLASKPSDEKSVRNEHSFRREHGFDVELLEGKAIAEHGPFDAPVAMLSDGDAQVDPVQLTRLALAMAEGKGLRVYQDCEVKSVTGRRAPLKIETAAGPIVKAGKVVIATGYESAKFLPKPLGKLLSTFAIATVPIPHLRNLWRKPCLVWESARPYFYLRSTPDGRLICGGLDSEYVTDHRRDGQVGRKAAALGRKLARLFPAADVSIAYAWGGTFAESADGLAYIGPAPGLPHRFFALGYGGNGITYGAIASRILGDLCLGRRNADAKIFRLDR